MLMFLLTQAQDAFLQLINAPGGGIGRCFS
jgi:hypothetical protein